MKRTHILALLVMAFFVGAVLYSGCGGGGSAGGGSWSGGGDGVGTTAVAPSVTSVTNLNSAASPARPGDWLRIDGSGFGSAQGQSYVNFSFDNGTTATADCYCTWSDTSITCRIPQVPKKEMTTARVTWTLQIVVNGSSSGGSSTLNGDTTPNPTPEITPPSPTPTPTSTGTPSPTPTPTSTVTPSPSPSPSPTSGGGGGGGGGSTPAADPHLTSITPQSDLEDAESAVTFTLAGQKLESAGTVTFTNVDNTSLKYNGTGFTAWGATEIKGTVTMPGGKYTVQATVRGVRTPETVYFYKGKGDYTVDVKGAKKGDGR
ncbi:MAG: hypothetical protein AB2L14_04210 [Candidatus Xenobiia bacterium LiM19]